MGDEKFDDYGERAVKQPAQKALESGKKAVAAGKKANKGRPKKRNKPKSPPKPPRNPTNLTVNPGSKIGLVRFSNHLRKSKLPKKLRQKIKVRNDRIVIPGRIPKGVPRPQWLTDLLAIGEDWELTTGELQFVLRKDLKSFWGSRLLPDIDSGEDYGFFFIGPSELSGGVELRSDTNRCWILDGTPTGTNSGLTVPSYSLVKKTVKGGPNATRLVRVESDRGLVVVANRAQFYLLEKGSDCWGTDNLIPFPERKKKQPKIGRHLLRTTLLHELSAHAGLLSKKLPAEHENPRVEANVKAIESLDAAFQKENDAVANSVRKEFNFLKSAVIRK